MDIIGAWQKCPLYGDVPFIENQSKNQKSSKVNMKSIICHIYWMDQKTEKLKKMQSFFSF